MEIIMNAKMKQQGGIVKGAQPKIDASLYEKSKVELEAAIKFAEESKAVALEMLTLENSELDKHPRDIDIQGQVLKLRDYIFGKDNIISQLDGQLAEVNRVLDSIKNDKIESVN